MKKYTPAESERLQNKYLYPYEKSQLYIWFIGLMFSSVYAEYALNLSLLISAAEGDLK